MAGVRVVGVVLCVLVLSAEAIHTSNTIQASPVVAWSTLKEFGLPDVLADKIPVMGSLVARLSKLSLVEVCESLPAYSAADTFVQRFVPSSPSTRLAAFVQLAAQNTGVSTVCFISLFLSLVSFACYVMWLLALVSFNSALAMECPSLSTTGQFPPWCAHAGRYWHKFKQLFVAHIVSKVLAWLLTTFCVGDVAVSVLSSPAA